MKNTILFILVTAGLIIASCKDENLVPFCEFITPADSDVFYAGDKIFISLEASDADGEIAEIRLYINGLGITSLIGFPYNYLWDTKGLALGDYTLKAEAYDNDGSMNEASSIISLNNIRSGIFTDTRDGKKYKWVVIGDQTWMAANLVYLPSVNSPTVLSSEYPKYYVYDYDGANPNEASQMNYYKNYGVLYNQIASVTACPPGWHLPSNDEWNKMAEFISKENNEYNAINDSWYNVGLHLKSKTDWFNSGNGTDDYEFMGLPGGYVCPDTSAYFKNLEFTGNWWSRTEFGKNAAWYWILSSDNTELLHDLSYKQYGFNIRCIKDE